MNTLTFNKKRLPVIEKDNQIWISASDLAAALNYKRYDYITRIYNRNSDEFTSQMTETVKLTLSGNLTKTVRYFSLRGAHLIAMFSNTDIAKQFRKWVLDILDRESGNKAVDNYDVLAGQLARLETINECQKKLLIIYLNDFQDFLEKLSPHTAYNISVLLNKISVNIGLALNYASTAHPTRIVKTGICH